VGFLVVIVPSLAAFRLWIAPAAALAGRAAARARRVGAA
jgi:hypothetical protein